MAMTRRKPMMILEDLDKDRIERLTMFLEYREENAKDMEREALGPW